MHQLQDDSASSLHEEVDQCQDVWGCQEGVEAGAREEDGHQQEHGQDSEALVQAQEPVLQHG